MVDDQESKKYDKERLAKFNDIKGRIQRLKILCNYTYKEPYKYVDKNTINKKPLNDENVNNLSNNDLNDVKAKLLRRKTHDRKLP